MAVLYLLNEIINDYFVISTCVHYTFNLLDDSWLNLASLIGIVE